MEFLKVLFFASCGPLLLRFLLSVFYGCSCPCVGSSGGAEFLLTLHVIESFHFSWNLKSNLVWFCLPGWHFLFYPFQNIQYSILFLSWHVRFLSRTLFFSHWTNSLLVNSWSWETEQQLICSWSCFCVSPCSGF